MPACISLPHLRHSEMPSWGLAHKTSSNVDFRSAKRPPLDAITVRTGTLSSQYVSLGQRHIQTAITQWETPKEDKGSNASSPPQQLCLQLLPSPFPSFPSLPFFTGKMKVSVVTEFASQDLLRFKQGATHIVLDLALSPCSLAKQRWQEPRETRQMHISEPTVHSTATHLLSTLVQALPTR